MLLARLKQQPAESRRYVVDYSERLGVSELLSAVSGTDVSPVTSPALTVSASIGAGDNNLVIYIAGGTAGTEYKVQLRVTTTDPGTVLWEDEVIFRVEEV